MVRNSETVMVVILGTQLISMRLVIFCCICCNELHLEHSAASLHLQVTNVRRPWDIYPARSFNLVASCEPPPINTPYYLKTTLIFDSHSCFPLY